MPSLYIMIPIALVFCIIAIRLLLWAINSGQYDDLDKEAWRILSETEEPPPKQESPDQDDTPRDG